MRKTRLVPMFLSVRLPTLLAMWWRAWRAREPETGNTFNQGASRCGEGATSRKNQPRSVIIFRLDSLGDVVLTTPLFRELKKVWPASRLTVVVHEAYRSLLVTNPNIDELLSPPNIKSAWLPQGASRLFSMTCFYWRRLRGRHFDCAIAPRWDVDEHLATFLCLLTNAATRIGYSEKTSCAKQQINRGFDAAFTICLPPGPVQHELFRDLAIVQALGGAVSDAQLEVRLTDRDRKKASQLLAKASPAATLVALGIGACSPSRMWPLERYAQVVHALALEHRLQPVVVCSAGERQLASRLKAMLGGTAIIVNGVPLRHACAVLERCDLFIGNDSGCAHLAAAMNCKIVVISRHAADGDPNHFNSPIRFAPRSDDVRILQPATGLDDCRDACCSAQPHCIIGVSAEDVVSVARGLLSVAPVVKPSSSSLLWPVPTSRLLMYSHSTEAMRRAVEALRAGRNPPSSQA